MAKIRNNMYTLEIYRNKKYVPAFSSRRPSQVFIRAAMANNRLRVKMNGEVVYKKVV